MFYESARAYVEGAFGACHIERESQVLQDDMLLIDIPNIRRLMSSGLDNMTTKGLYLLAIIITGGSVKFEKTRCKLKKIIKGSLSSVLSSRNHNHHQLEIFKQIFGLVTNPQHFRDNCEPLYASRSLSNHAAIKKVLDGLNSFPYQTLIAMRRKLKGVEATVPKLLPHRQGWRREHLTKLIRKISTKMLSQHGEGDELQEPLAKAMAVADLSLKLATGCHNIFSTEFYSFSPEIKSLQNDIMKAIWLVKNVVGIPVLRNLEPLVESKAKLSNGCLRTAFIKLLTEFLFECSDMDSIPKSLIDILDVINRSSNSMPYGILLKENIEEEVNCILNVSAQAKQVVLDMLPDHRFDEDFTDAYVEQLEESDDDVFDDCQLEENRHFINGEYDPMDSNYEAESIGQFVPPDHHPSSSMADGENTNPSAVSRERGSDESFVIRHDLYECNTGMDLRNVAANSSCEMTGPGHTQDSICKNQYLVTQDVCDETSMLTYNLIGLMLKEFAKSEGLELNGSKSLYLRGGNQIKDVDGIPNF